MIISYTPVRSSKDLGGGRFAIERALLAQGHFLDPRERGEEWPWLLAWIDLQGLAVYRSLGNLKRGEVETSQRELSQRWAWGRSKVRRFLDALEKKGEIERRDGTGDGTVIRIVRYNEVQFGSTATADRPPTDPADRPSRAQASQRPSTGSRPTQSTGSRPTHSNTEEEKIHRAHEGDTNGPSPLQRQARESWTILQKAERDGQLDPDGLPPLAAMALNRVGGPKALQSARQRKYGEQEIRTEFTAAYLHLAGVDGRDA